MKILHINSYYSESRFYKNLYDKQIESGLDIDVFVPVSTNANSRDFELGDYATISKNHGKYDRFLFHVKHSKIYEDLINKYAIEEYAITHAHSLFSNGYIALKLKKEFGAPYIVAVRNTDVNVFFKYMIHVRNTGTQILKEAEKIIFLSEAYRNIVIEKYVPYKLKREILRKTIIIPNGIDDFWFQNKVKFKEIPNQKNLRLLYVGAINKNKNLITTTKAVEMLQKKGYKVRFTIVGRIEDKSVYRQIKDLPYVNYIVSKPKEQLIYIYRANDIFVMPSITETFGIVYPEAMSQGLPVIYTRGQGFDGHFEEGEVGFSVNCINANEIVDKIIKIIESYSEISHRCVELVNRFDWNKITKDYKIIYDNMIKG